MEIPRVEVDQYLFVILELYWGWWRNGIGLTTFLQRLNCISSGNHTWLAGMSELNGGLYFVVLFDPNSGCSSATFTPITMASDIYKYSKLQHSWGL